MALTTEEREHPDMVSPDRMMSWEEIISWLRAKADQWEKVLPEDLRGPFPASLRDWVSSLIWEGDK